MALDRSKVLETAQKHLAKGNYDKAIAEYQKLVKEDPRDVRTWLKIGDLYTRQGKRTEAVETYGRVAEHYAQQGFFLKAVAVYKQILKLDPGRLDVSLRLAEMYEQLQLVSDALSTYELVAGAYARAGQVDRALDTLGKMCALDPENIPVRIKYAEALSKAGRTENAAMEFEAGAMLLKQQGRMDDYIKVAERLLFHRPDDAATARELSELYLARNDAKRALGKLQLCFKANPKDVGTLELLAGAFHSLGQLQKTISVFREIARIHQEENRAEDRARTLKRILEMDPNDAEARQALAGYAPRPAAPVVGPPPSAVVDSRAALRPSAPEEPDLEVIEADDDDVYILDDELVEEALEMEEVEPAPAPPPARESVPSYTSPSIPPDVAREAQIARLLTECDVFLRYGLKNKVIEQLHKVVEMDPTHVEARERLKETYMDTGQPEKAIEQLYALSDVFAEEKPQLAQLYLKQILEIDPNNEVARSRVVVSQPAPAPPPAAEEDEILFVDDEEPPAFTDRTVDEGMHGPVVTLEEAEPVTITDPEQMLPGAVTTDPGSAPRIPGEMHAMPPPAMDVYVPAPTGPSSVPAPLPPVSPAEFDASIGEAERKKARAEAEQRLSLPPGEVEETLDEADFFLAQGLYDEARATIRDALESHRGHPVLQDKLAEIEEAAAMSASLAPPASAPEDQSFELAEKLAEELGPIDDTAGSDVLDVEAVFAQFKKGVNEQIGLEDSDTHFDLGIAYKEMGLLDDATHEFELSMSNPQRECIAHTMIGLCHLEKGQIADAISHFKKGLYAENKTEREELGLYFELGNAYELLHDPKEALYYYQKVHKRQPDFRNVDEKIKQLVQPQAQQGQSAPAPSADDVDAAFDDLISDTE